MTKTWVETLIPFTLIGLAVCGMGGIPYGIHLLYYGKPKAHGVDEWDRCMQDRDDRLNGKEPQTYY